MKPFIIFVLFFFSFCIAFTQTTKPKPATTSTTQSHQTLYFRGYGPCYLSKEITENEKKTMLDCIGHDSSATQIRHDFEVKNYSNGIYLVKLTSDKEIFVKRFSKN
jgi:hypothetical protein